MRPVPRPKNQLDSFRYAIEGIVHVFRTQKHMRAHFFIVVLVLLLGMFCRFSAVQMVELLLVMSTVLVAEMFNTAVETVVDMITQSYHPLAKLAKDIAAGAVLMTAITAGVVGAVLFIGSVKLDPMRHIVARDPHSIFLWVPITVIVLLLVVVLIAKVMGGKGTILRGGVVSGHAAVAFSLAVTIVYRSGIDVLTTCLAVVLAFLVAHARVEGKVHTLQEVIIGGLLGICFTTGVYYFRIGNP
jgi:diacylglycerol kinase (ATP)